VIAGRADHGILGNKPCTAPDTLERLRGRIPSEPIGLVLTRRGDVQHEPPRLLWVQRHPGDRVAVSAMDFAPKGVEHEALASLVNSGQVLLVDDLAR